MNAKLLDNMMRYGIGLDPWFWVRSADMPNYPPHNIDQLDEDRYRLTLAVAGFSPAEIQVTVEGDLLTVKGCKTNGRCVDDPPTNGIKTVYINSDSSTDGTKTLYRGIAFRDWSRQFKIGDHVHVANATMQHGLLLIDLVRELPESQKPKVIDITIG